MNWRLAQPQHVAEVLAFQRHPFEAQEILCCRVHQQHPAIVIQNQDAISNRLENGPILDGLLLLGLQGRTKLIGLVGNEGV